jgi:hypothetical protein
MLKYSKINNVAIEDIIAGSAHCPGCGARMHSDDPSTLGYLDPQSVTKYVQDAQVHTKTKQALLSYYQTQLDRKASTTPPTDTADVHAFDYKDIQAFERIEKQKPITCQRCFELTNYGNLVSSVDISAQDFYTKLHRLREKNALIVLVMDLFNVENSFIPRFEEIVGTENPVLIVGNKCDLLPHDAKFARIEVWLRQQVVKRMPKLVHKQHDEEENALDGILGHNTRSQIRGVMLVSSKTGENVISLAHRIEKLRQGTRDVFIVGCTNVGKSTLINQLMSKFHSKRLSKEKKQEIATRINSMSEYERLIHDLNYDKNFNSSLTTSILPGTTLRTISFQLATQRNDQIQRSHLFDTPGVINPELVFNYLSPKDWKLITPTHKLKPHHYRLRPKRSLFLGGLARIDYVSNNVPQESWNIIFFTLFASTKLPLHSTSIDKAQQVYEKHFGTSLLSPPLVNDVHDGSSLTQEQVQNAQNHTLYGLTKKKTLELVGTTRGRSIVDIVIPGVGWIAVTGVGEITIDVHVPEKLQIVTRDPLMPFETLFLRKDKYVDI